MGLLNNIQTLFTHAVTSTTTDPAASVNSSQSRAIHINGDSIRIATQADGGQGWRISFSPRTTEAEDYQYSIDIDSTGQPTQAFERDGATTRRLTAQDTSRLFSTLQSILATAQTAHSTAIKADPQPSPHTPL